MPSIDLGTLKEPFSHLRVDTDYVIVYSHNKNEESTDGIDLSASASFSLRDNGPWRLAIKGQITPRDTTLEELSIIGE